jgi:hypothetical protein
MFLASDTVLPLANPPTQRGLPGTVARAPLMGCDTLWRKMKEYDRWWLRFDKKMEQWTLEIPGLRMREW